MMFLAQFPKFSGDNSVGETPDPIPNSAVKPHCADGPARETSVGEKDVAGYFFKPLTKMLRAFLLWVNLRLKIRLYKILYFVSVGKLGVN